MPRPLQALFPSILIALLLATPALAEDWVVLLGEVEIREKPGFAEKAMERSPDFSPYKVLRRLEAEKEGSQVWYEIVLREDRRVKKTESKGWVLELPEDTGGPLARASVPVYKMPDAGTLIGPRQSRELKLTGQRSPDRKWHQVTFPDKMESVRHHVGYVPASLAWLEEDPDLTELIPRLERIRNSKWPPRWKAQCVRRTIQKGFPRAAVELSLGEPGEITTTKKGDEIWIYRKQGEMVGIYFKDGKVTGWKKRKT